MNTTESTSLDSKPKTSSLFCDPNADVTFVSVDDVIFKIYSKYFAAVSSGFLAPEFIIDNDQPVALSEPAEVLEILFQFVHPPPEYQQLRQPLLANLMIGLFFDVAVAAEKYVVYAAMNTCVARMQYKLYMSHPVQVLNYAANHGYVDLADLAALQTISLAYPVEEALAGLTDSGVAFKWMKYYGRWTQVPKFVHDLFLRSPFADCPRVSDMDVNLLRNLTLNPTEINFGSTKSKCLYERHDLCDCREGRWVGRIYARIAAIPKFSQIS